MGILNKLPKSKQVILLIDELFEKEKRLFRLCDLHKILSKEVEGLTLFNLQEILKRYFHKNRLFINKPNFVLYGSEKTIKKMRKYLYEQD
jgi:hypothetical protein